MKFNKSQTLVGGYYLWNKKGVGNTQLYTSSQASVWKGILRTKS